MAETLTFEPRFLYDASKPSITVPVALTLGGTVVLTNAKVDTGSTLCVFQREHGEELGLPIEDGALVTLETVNERFEAFRFDVTLVALGLELTVPVHFPRYSSGRNILGRRGFLEQLRLGIVDYDGVLYVSRYDDNGVG